MLKIISAPGTSPVLRAVFIAFLSILSGWATSSLRAWLNNDFYNTAFTLAEKLQIGTAYNKNKSASSITNKYTGVDTYDKIFIISFDEAGKSEYGFKTTLYSDETRQIKPTDYANCQGCYKYTGALSSNVGYSYWWLRMPKSSAEIIKVDVDGSKSISYGIGGPAGSTYIGVCPALKFNPKSGVSADFNKNRELKYKSTDKINIPEISGTTITYQSSDTNVATVDKEGNITAIGRGTATIACIITDEYGDTNKNTFTVNVYFSFGQWLIWIFLLGFLWY